jgi:hypothetical protein
MCGPPVLSMLWSMDELIAPRLRLFAVLGGLAIALLLAGFGPSSASAASVVGPSGQISGCYVKKGKAKGTLRVVPPGKRCKKSEKPVSWAAQGQSGQSGQSGAQGGSGQTSITALQDRITQLESQVTQLESILAGVTNSDLLGAITNATKLNGISAADLTGALASVDSLCTEVGTQVVPKVNTIGSGLTGLSLGGVIPLGLTLPVPTIPSLATYACP